MSSACYQPDASASASNSRSPARPGARRAALPRRDRLETERGWRRAVLATTERLLAFGSPNDQLFVHGREVYWLSRSGIGESPLSGPTFERLLGMPATVRNITTVRKLAAKYAPQPA